jgi:hypothetical protein
VQRTAVLGAEQNAEKKKAAEEAAVAKAKIESLAADKHAAAAKVEADRMAAEQNAEKQKAAEEAAVAKPKAVAKNAENDGSQADSVPDHIDLPSLHDSVKAVFAALHHEADANGTVSKRAIKAAISASPVLCFKFGFKHSRIRHFSEWFDTVDTDHDGRLSKRELDGWVRHHAVHHSLKEAISDAQNHGSFWLLLVAAVVLLFHFEPPVFWHYGVIDVGV